MRYLNSDEWNLCLLKNLSNFRSDALIRLKLDGEIDAPLYQVFCVLQRNFDAVSIFDFNQIYWTRCGSPTQSLRERAAKRIVSLGRVSYAKALAAQNPHIGRVLPMVATAKQTLFLQCSK